MTNYLLTIELVSKVKLLVNEHNAPNLVMSKNHTRKSYHQHNS